RAGRGRKEEAMSNAGGRPRGTAASRSSPRAAVATHARGRFSSNPLLTREAKDVPSLNTNERSSLMFRALYDWLMHAILGRIAASAVMKVSAAADAQDAETRAELTRRADELEKAGHKEEAAALRSSAARLTLQSPLGQAQAVFLPISLEV